MLAAHYIKPTSFGIRKLTLLGYLPPPPPGYAIGYFDGYMVVYDPASFQILSWVDLLD
jgi:hypothetical protein